MIYLRITKQDDGDCIIKNFPETEELPENFRSFESKKLKYKIEVGSDEADINISNRIFKRVALVIAEVLTVILDYFEKRRLDSSHTIKTLQTHAKQKLEGLIDHEVIKSAHDYEDLVEKVKSTILKDPIQAAKTTIYLQKRIFEIGAHLTVQEMMHGNVSPLLQIQDHNIRRVSLNVLGAFYDQLKDNKLKFEFKFSDEIGERNKVSCDYETMNLALYNFYDNAVKYAKPGSVIIHTLDEKTGEYVISIQMMSLRIDESESEDIFSDGYRGIHSASTDIEGSGLGMHVVRWMLELNGLTIKHDPDYSKSETFDDKPYILNKFHIKKLK